MKAIKSLLAVSVLAAAGAANAASVTTTNLSGTQSLTDNGQIFGTYAYVPGVYVGSGDATGGVYNGVVHFTTSLSAAVDTTIGLEWTINAAGSTATQLITSCSDAGLAAQCGTNYIVGSTRLFTLDAYTFGAGVGGVTFTAHRTDVSPQLGNKNVTSTYNFAGTAVPVPAAAWLFGSGLLGLAGTARRRRSA